MKVGLSAPVYAEELFAAARASANRFSRVKLSVST